ncbi:MAG TPA: metallophosphoesterase family protein [Bacteroidales bacterium]|nr:metallophosphoesterase family protein [Bacteroidales bacterium]
MKCIGLISDTHGYIHPRMFSFFSNCDEIWHAGDICNTETIDKLRSFKPVRAVYGNIDDGKIRLEYNEYEVFTVDGLKVILIHIGGYPGRYTKLAWQLINKHKPGLFISGHSHILKVIPDKKNNLLHINPGASGNSGQHNFITFIKFSINNSELTDLEIFEAVR